MGKQMTNEEIAKQIFDCFLHTNCPKDCNFVEYNGTCKIGLDNIMGWLYRAYKSLDESEKYKWHDLRKDPNDLPEVDDYTEVLVSTDKYDYCVGCFFRDYKGNGHFTTDDDYDRLLEPIAWKFVEPF